MLFVFNRELFDIELTLTVSVNNKLLLLLISVTFFRCFILEIFWFWFLPIVRSWGKGVILLFSLVSGSRWASSKLARSKYGQWLKGVTGNVWWFNWICNIVDKLFRIHLRNIKRFYDVYLLSLSAKLTFKIINLGGYVFRIGFLKLLNNND